MTHDTIIIGAGPAGLLAAYELATQGHPVTILEARDRIGGRVHTIRDTSGALIERGAEFVHGSLPVTLALLKEAGLSYTAMTGRWVQIKNSAGSENEDEDDGDWALMMKRLKGLDADTTLSAFLEAHFPGPEYDTLKERAIAYAEGYDCADASRVSAKALYREWSAGEEEQFRVDDGYSALMDFLADRCRAAGCGIQLGQEVLSVEVVEDGIIVRDDRASYTAQRVIIALPLGVLQHRPLLTGPGADQCQPALEQLGMGDIIKIVFRFREAFWEARYPGMGFLMSDAEVPTWWTQAPAAGAVLTGWMPGRRAQAKAGLTDEQLIEVGLSSLAQIFSLDRADLLSRLEETQIANWSAEPLTRGAYAYTTVRAAEAQKMLADPMGGKIFFAGEYMYDGNAMGTVEAAFQSGKSAAHRLLARLVE